MIEIEGRHIHPKMICGYHYFRSSVLFRLYFCIDLITGKQITIYRKNEDYSDIVKKLENILKDSDN